MNDPLFCNMTWKMREKYNKYWGGTEKLNLILLIAIVLDPCNKLEYI